VVELFSTNILIGVIVALSIGLCVSLYYLFKFSLILIRVEDSIEDSLDILDERYKKMTEILEIPVFFDSIEVRNCIAEIRKSRDAILFVANSLTQKNQGTNLAIEAKKNREESNAV
jgi:hypothetical protein